MTRTTKTCQCVAQIFNLSFGLDSTCLVFFKLSEEISQGHCRNYAPKKFFSAAIVNLQPVECKNL